MDLFGDPEPEIVEDLSVPVVEDPTGLLPAREARFCMGHDAVEGRLLDLFKCGKLAHGYLFNGARGIGKATMAFRFARFLLNNAEYDPNQESLFGDAPDFSSMDIDVNGGVFRQVASGGHPDLFVVERAYDATKNIYKNAVDVAAIRKVEPFLRKTSSYGGWRVVIVDDANTMNRNAQNALLKILEEPPKKTIIILVTHAMGALLPTILSRTQVIPFQSLNDDVITDLLRREDFEDVQDCVRLGAGSAGMALNYAQAGAGDMLKDIVELCEGRLPWSKNLSFAERISKGGQGEDYRIFELLCVWIYRQAAVAKARGQGIAMMEERLRSFSLELLLEVCDSLSVHFADIKHANLDKKQGVLQALAMMS